jgi:soluble cytochrome b562
MNLRSTLALILVLPVFAPALSRADTPPPAPAPGAPSQPSDDKDTDLEVRMKKMGKAFRQLRKQVADPAQNASSLDLVATILAASKEAADFTPQKADDIPADQRDKFIADYKAGIKALQDKLASLTDALTAGKNDEATKIVADIFDFEKKSHKDFKKPENH